MEKEIKSRHYSEIENKLADHPVLQRVYAARGIRHSDELCYQLKRLLPFSNLLNIQTAVQRIALALEEQQSILIVGDYDNCNAGENCRRIGNTLAVGDINGDGIQDLLLGTTDQDEQGLHNYNALPVSSGLYHRPGKSYVFYGRPRVDWSRWYDIPYNEYDIVITGDTGRELGYQVAIGNLNNDNYGDLVITAPSLPFSGNPDPDWFGRTYVIFGSSSLPAEINVDNIVGSGAGAVITGESVYQGQYATKVDGFGLGIAVGDINGDHIDDLLVDF